MPSLDIITIPVLTDNYIYMVHGAGQTVVIDPSVAPPVLKVLQEKSWHLDYILNTHHHPDHIGGNTMLAEKTGAKVIGFQGDKARIPDIAIMVEEGNILELCGEKVIVMHVPAHTMGHIAYYWPESQRLFCGDTLFAMGCGYLFEGNAEHLHASLQRLVQLPASTRIYCAHEYTEANGRFALTVEPGNNALVERMERVKKLRAQQLPTLPTTLVEELRTNPFLRCHSSEIRKKLGMEKSQDSEVCGALRHLKDNF